MKVHPFNNKIVVDVSRREERTAAGLILPPNEGPKQGGIVVAVGPGKLNHETGKIEQQQHIKVGDHVVFQPGRGAVIMVNGIAHLLFDADELLGKIEE